jgi:hypothetical protein
MQFTREEIGRVRSREMELAEQVVQRAQSYEHGLEVQASERVALLSQEAGAHLQHQTLVQNEAVASLAATQASAAGEALVARQALMTSEELAMQLRAANTRIQEEAMIAYRQAESATEQRLRSEFQQALANTRAGEQKAADQAERAVQQASLSVAQQAMANEQFVQSRLAEVLRKTEAEVALARAQADEEVRRQRDASAAAALEAQRTLQATWQEMQNQQEQARRTAWELEELRARVARETATRPAAAPGASASYGGGAASTGAPPRARDTSPEEEEEGDDLGGDLPRLIARALAGTGSSRTKEAETIRVPPMPSATQVRAWRTAVRQEIAAASGKGDMVFNGPKRWNVKAQLTRL